MHFRNPAVDSALARYGFTLVRVCARPFPRRLLSTSDARRRESCFAPRFLYAARAFRAGRHVSSRAYVAYVRSGARAPGRVDGKPSRSAKGGGFEFGAADFIVAPQPHDTAVRAAVAY